MQKYKFTQEGVLRIDTGEHIHEDPREEKWQHYLAWAKQHTTEPEHSEQELLTMARQGKQDAIEAAFRTATTQPLAAAGTLFPGGELAMIELDRARRFAALSGLDVCDYPDVDGIERALDLTAADQLLTEMIKAYRPMAKAKRKKLRELAMATSMAEIDAITW